MLTVTSYGQPLLIPTYTQPISRLRMEYTRVSAVWGYDYEHNGKSISFAAGEMFDLVDKSNADWWLVSRSLGEKFYVPANYLKEEQAENKVLSQSPKTVPKPLSPKPSPKPIKQVNSGGEIERLKTMPPPPVSKKRNLVNKRFEEVPAMSLAPEMRTKKCPTVSYHRPQEGLNNSLASKLNRGKMQLPPIPTQARYSADITMLKAPDGLYDTLEDSLYDRLDGAFDNANSVRQPQPAPRTELSLSESLPKKTEQEISPSHRIPRIPEVPNLSNSPLHTTENIVRNLEPPARSKRRVTMHSTSSNPTTTSPFDIPGKRTNTEGANNIRQVRVLPSVPSNRSASLSDDKVVAAPEKKKVDLTNSLPGGGDTSSSLSPHETSPPQVYTYQPPQTQGMFTFGSVQLEKRGNVTRFRKEGGLFRGGKWESQYMVMENFIISFYKDSKVARSDKTQYQHILHLQHCTVHLVTETKDRKHQFKLVEQESNEETLCQAEDDQSMNEWFSLIQTTISQCAESPRKISIPDSQDVPHTDAKIDEKMKDKLRKFLRQRPNMETLQKKGILRYSVFGSPLESVVEKEHQKIPDFVLKCIKEVETRGLDVVGIYRLAGNTSQVQKLRYIVDQEQLYFLDDLDKWDDINIITGALKLFLREMPEPLIPFSKYDAFVESAYISDTRERAAFLRNLLSTFPQPNFDLFYLLCNHLDRVIQESEINKMKSSNLAIVFGPTLVRPEIDTAMTVGHFTAINNSLEFLLSRYRELFKC